MDERCKIYHEMIDELDESYRLMHEYDSMIHDYGTAVLYQAESKIIHLVGEKPGVTAVELSAILKKTPSACSQILRKLRRKGWIEQTRNADNNREYNLNLTPEGWAIYEGHNQFEQRCYKRTYHNLGSFSDEQLMIYVEIQKKLNETFIQDVEESREASVNKKPESSHN
nr:MarR family transcriptional regulator [Clostridium transplantifaecale]